MRPLLPQQNIRGSAWSSKAEARWAWLISAPSSGWKNTEFLSVTLLERAWVAWLGGLYATRSAVEARELVQTIRSSSSRNDKMITARENGPGKTVEGGPLLSESSTSEPRT